MSLVKSGIHSRKVACIAAAMGMVVLMVAVAPPASASGGTLQWTSTTPSSQDLAGGGVAVSPTGGILVEGQTESGRAGITVTHFLASGQLDRCFGSTSTSNCTGNGTVTVTTTEALSYSGAAIAVQSDGKILAAGGIRPPSPTNSAPYGMGVVRLNSNGTIDTTFGNVPGEPGAAILNPCSSANSSAASVTVETNSTIVMVGTANCSADLSHQMLVARLTPNGIPDRTFGGGNGYEVYDGALSSGGYDGAVNPSTGDIIAVGQQDACGGANCWFIEALTSAGALDRSFNGTGTMTMSPGGSQMSSAFNVAFVGTEIVVSGGCNLTSPTQRQGWYICAAKMTSSGALDGTFGNSSPGTMMMWDCNRASQTMAVQRDGSLVFGSVGPLVARAYASGKPDQSFGTDGPCPKTANPPHVAGVVVFSIAGYGGGGVNGVAVNDATSTVYAAGTTGTACSSTSHTQCVAFAAALNES